MWTVSYLIGYPQCQEKLQEEFDQVVGSKRLIGISDRPNLPYTMAVVTEVQRCASILSVNVPRTSPEDVVIEGYTIPKGTPIVPQISTVMYNERVII